MIKKLWDSSGLRAAFCVTGITLACCWLYKALYRSFYLVMQSAKSFFKTPQKRLYKGEISTIFYNNVD